MQWLYKTLEQPNQIQENQINGSILKLQLALVLYQIIGSNSEALYNILFAPYMNLCCGNLPNLIFKEAVASFNAILAFNPSYFKNALGKLDTEKQNICNS